MTKQTHSEVEAEALKEAKAMFDLQYATLRACVHQPREGKFAAVT